MSCNGFPNFFDNLPIVDIGYPALVVRVLKGEQCVAAICATAEVMVEPHTHGAQWGVVIDGEVELKIAGKVRKLVKGDTYNIPAGIEHGARIAQGSRLLEFFEEADRFTV